MPSQSKRLVEEKAILFSRFGAVIFGTIRKEKLFL